MISHGTPLYLGVSAATSCKGVTKQPAGLGLSIRATADTVIVTFLECDAATDAILAIQTSADLTNWTTVPATFTTVADSNGVRTVNGERLFCPKQSPGDVCQSDGAFGLTSLKCFTNSPSNRCGRVRSTNRNA